MVWVMNELSLLEFRSDESDARSMARVEQAFEDRRRRMLKGTLFDQLELHWICTRPEIDAAWKRFQTEFSPERIARFPEARRPDLEKMVSLGKDAYDRLCNDQQRREYRVSVTDKTMVESSAEMLAKKGDMAIMKGQLQEAIDCFAKANELMPNVPEYRDGLNRARSTHG